MSLQICPREREGGGGVLFSILCGVPLLNFFTEVWGTGSDHRIVSYYSLLSTYACADANSHSMGYLSSQVDSLPP